MTNGSPEMTNRAKPSRTGMTVATVFATGALLLSAANSECLKRSPR